MTCELSNEYIAGFFDGEGCITSQLTYITGKYETYPRVNVSISITQKERGILDKIQAIYGGTVHGKKDVNNRCFHLRITGKEHMGNFLKAIYPYSIIKKAQIEIALEFIESLRVENLGCVGLSKETHDMRKRVHDKLRLLKKAS